MPDRSWRSPPPPASWSVAWSYIFVRKLNLSRVHSGHEVNWVVLAPFWFRKSSTPDMEQLHPNWWLGMVSGQCQSLGKLCLSPELLGVDQNHARGGLSNNSQDGGALVLRHCPGMAQLAGLDDPRVNPAPQMCQRTCPPILWIDTGSTLSMAVWKAPHTVSSGQKVGYGIKKVPG